MIAWIVTNKYYVSESFLRLKKLLFDSARNKGIDLLEYNNVDIVKMLYSHNYEMPSFVLFWNKDIKLARFLESEGMKVFNSSDSIRISDDKSLIYITLRDSDVAQPKTYFSPLLYYDNIANDPIIDFIIEDLRLPLVFKECAGSFGQQVYLINSKKELASKISDVGNRSYIMQEFVATSFGKDIRIYVVGEKVVAAMKRQNLTGGFRANIEVGGMGEKYNPSSKEIDIALKASRKIGLDFCGVDLLYGDSEERILCEVNSNAYFNEIDKISGVKVEDAIFEHILSCLKR